MYVSGEATAWTDDAGYLTGNHLYVNSIVYMIALTFIYEGQRDFGMNLLHRWLEIYCCEWGYTWDGVNVQGRTSEDGERSSGDNYYQNMALWGVLAALQGEDISGLCKPGGLVSRIIEAGKPAD